MTTILPCKQRLRLRPGAGARRVLSVVLMLTIGDFTFLSCSSGGKQSQPVSQQATPEKKPAQWDLPWLHADDAKHAKMREEEHALIDALVQKGDLAFDQGRKDAAAWPYILASLFKSDSRAQDRMLDPAGRTMKSVGKKLAFRFKATRDEQAWINKSDGYIYGNNPFEGWSKQSIEGDIATLKVLLDERLVGNLRFSILGQAGTAISISRTWEGGTRSGFNLAPPPSFASSGGSVIRFVSQPHMTAEEYFKTYGDGECCLSSGWTRGTFECSIIPHPKRAGRLRLS